MLVRASDFEYDGRRLSDFGFTICTFGGSGDLDIIDTGFDISFTKVKRNNGRKYGIASSQYENCATTIFQICKCPDQCGGDTISDEEYRELARWLNRHEYLRFRLLNELDDGDSEPCYFNASINIGKVYMADRLYGLELRVDTDAPYGFGNVVEKTWTLNANGTANVTDLSDDIGEIRPDITVTCGSAGTLTLTNPTCETVTTVKNCTSGEVINFYGDTQIITSSLSTHKIHNDFNFVFPKIGNTMASRKNPFAVSMPCTLKVRYAPVIKDIP